MVPYGGLRTTAKGPHSTTYCSTMWAECISPSSSIYILYILLLRLTTGIAMSLMLRDPLHHVTLGPLDTESYLALYPTQQVLLVNLHYCTVTYT